MLALLGLAISAVAGLASAGAINRSTKAANEARNVQTANETISNRVSRRQAAKRERLVRAQVRQSSANTGTSGSSGELGALGALRTSTGASLGEQKRNILAIKGINSRLKSAASHSAAAERFSIFGEIGLKGIEFFEKEDI